MTDPIADMLTRIRNAGVARFDKVDIPASRMKELFEPFHQLDGSITRRQGGTGMGLYLCKQIVEAHGSKITLQSKEGSGSRFLFDLSVARPAEAKP